jgi:hypothetical protein
MALIGINLAFIGLLLGLDLFYTTLAILLVEAAIASLGGLVVYGVIYSVETWF